MENSDLTVEDDSQKPRPSWFWPVVVGGGILLAILLGLLLWYFLKNEEKAAVDSASVVIPPPITKPAPPVVSPDASLRRQLAQQKALNRALMERARKLKERLAGDICGGASTTSCGANGILLPGSLGSQDPARPGPAQPGPGAATPPEDTTPPEIAEPPGKDPTTPIKGGTAQKLSTTAMVTLLENGTVLILTQDGTGSGFFIAPSLIVTNRHVIEGAKENIYVTSRTIGWVHKAKVMARSSAGTPGQRDFALLSVDQGLGRDFSFPINPAPAKLDTVIAAGYPGLIVGNDESFGRLLKGDASAAPDLVLSKGEISANQTSGGGVDTLVHTAQIMPGNSGGPLVDACGRVVGINTFIAVEQTGKAGFALSSREVLNFLGTHNVVAKVDERACVD